MSFRVRIQARGGRAVNNWDIEVMFTGVRPGERLFEELFVDGEGYGRTRHENHLAAMNSDDCGADRPPQVLGAMVDRPNVLAQAGDRPAVLLTPKEIVPQYRPSGKA